jgi:hypothetical protein
MSVLGGRTLETAPVLHTVDPDPLRAAEELAAYDAAGTERVTLAPCGGWRRDYEHAAKLRAALRTA